MDRVPVSSGAADSWSFLNSGTNFGSVGGKINIASAGTGRCFGAELSLFKHYSDGYYFTATGSYVRMEYTGSDGVLRFGAFDNIFICNVLAGFEWRVSHLFTMEYSAKYSVAGGAPYVPIDVEKSKRSNQTSYLDVEAFSVRKPMYNRLDLKIDFRFNYSDFSLVSFVSAENLLNASNVLEYQWSIPKQQVETVYQLGLFLLGGVRVEF
jgi:hypothetical protein